MRIIALPPTHLTPIWLPGGIAVAALITRPGWAALPTIFVANLAVVAFANHYPVLSYRPYSMLICAVNTLEPAVAAYIWKTWLKESPFEHAWGFLKFTAGVCLAPALLVAWMLIGVIVLSGREPGLIMGSRQFLVSAAITSVSDALGIIATANTTLEEFARGRQAALSTV